jgi:hypothetical protein
MTKKFKRAEYTVAIRQNYYDVEAANRDRTIYQLSKNRRRFQLSKVGSFYELVEKGEVICRTLTISFKRTKAHRFQRPPTPAAAS